MVRIDIGIGKGRPTFPTLLNPHIEHLRKGETLDLTPKFSTLVRGPSGAPFNIRFNIMFTSNKCELTRFELRLTAPKSWNSKRRAPRNDREMSYA